MTLASEYSFVFTKFLLRSELLLAMIYKNNNQGVGLGFTAFAANRYDDTQLVPYQRLVNLGKDGRHD